MPVIYETKTFSMVHLAICNPSDLDTQFYSFSATCNKWRAFSFQIYKFNSHHCTQSDDSIFIFRFFSSFILFLIIASLSLCLSIRMEFTFIVLRQLNEIYETFNRIDEMEREYLKILQEIVHRFANICLVFANI